MRPERATQRNDVMACGAPAGALLCVDLLYQGFASLTPGYSLSPLRSFKKYAAFGKAPELPGTALQQNPIVFLFILVVIFFTSGCAYNMSWQPRYNPMSPSNFFADQRSERPIVEGTVASNQMLSNDPFYTGQVDGKDVTNVPVPVTLDLLNRGRERFDIYCSPCHSRLGNGEGMVVQRGFARPPTFHSDRLRQAPDGHIFAVITEGIGRMWSYANRVDVPDRWAIIAYIRALQFSQSASLSDVPQNEAQKLQGQKQ